MNIEWKYCEKFDESDIAEVEKKLGIVFPDDYKSLLSKCNGAKPMKSRFDIHGRKGCVIDYMLMINPGDANSVLKTAEMQHRDGVDKKLIPIASDPFGGFIAYNYGASSDNPELIFFSHETRKITFIARNFSTFLALLY